MKRVVDDTAEVIGKDLGDILIQCRKNGMRLPFLLAMVSVNGSLFYARYKRDKLEPLAVHSVGNFFNWPINMLLVDAAGDTAQIVFDGPEGEATFH
jgi:hypothetical protein